MAAGLSPPETNPRETEDAFSGAKGGREPPKRPPRPAPDDKADFQDTHGLDDEEPDMFSAKGSAAGAQEVPPSPESSKHPGSPQQFSVLREAAQAETIAAKDALDRESLTKAVADLLTTRKDQYPLAMALFGAWGAGKSSFIDFVKKELGTRPATSFRFAEFNAWRNERVDNIGAALSQAVVEALIAERSFSQQVSLAFKLSRKRKERLRKALATDASNAWGWLQNAWMSFSSALVYFAWPLAVALMFLVLLVETDFSKWLLGTVGTAVTGLTALISVRLVLSNELLDWFKKLAKDQKFTFKLLPDYAENLGSNHEMGRTLEDLCALTLAVPDDVVGQGGFLMLVIDDLDRCSPDTIKQVFDAVRLVANIPQVVVLVALDERIAYSAVAKHYAEYGFSDRETAQVARDYMSKVFNVFVTLPGAQKSAIENYVRVKLFDMPAKVVVQPPDSEASDDVPPPVLSGDSSKLEVEAFTELASEFELKNPRELWRLRQTWSLLKGFALGQHSTDNEVRLWMRHMFFREAFLRGTASERKTAQPVVDKLAAGTGLDASDALWSPSLTKSARELATGFAKRDAAVMTVLLPAAPAELKAAVKA